MKRLLLAAMFVGCGGGEGGGLTCDYLASPDNCFKTTATAATSCLPADTDIGVLAADNASCTYASGHVITFATPLVLPLPNDAEWNYTVTFNGAECLHYQDDANGFDLTVGADTVSESLDNGLSLTCPDGSTLSNGNPLELLSCPGENFGDLPGNTTSSGSTSVTFGFLNTGSPDVLTVFDCQR